LRTAVAVDCGQRLRVRGGDAVPQGRISASPDAGIDGWRARRKSAVGLCARGRGGGRDGNAHEISGNGMWEDGECPSRRLRSTAPILGMTAQRSLKYTGLSLESANCRGYGEAFVDERNPTD
jgi:hypothetical protein